MHTSNRNMIGSHCFVIFEIHFREIIRNWIGIFYCALWTVSYLSISWALSKSLIEVWDISFSVCGCNKIKKMADIKKSFLFFYRSKITKILQNWKKWLHRLSIEAYPSIYPFLWKYCSSKDVSVTYYRKDIMHCSLLWNILRCTIFPRKRLDRWICYFSSGDEWFFPLL